VVVACAGTGDSASGTCPHTNFVASLEAGRTRLHHTPGCTGQVLSMPDAIATGRDTFAGLLMLDR
jgi:hypothetical protein